jgi:Do/DeqQ family serine protease
MTEGPFKINGRLGVFLTLLPILWIPIDAGWLHAHFDRENPVVHAVRDASPAVVNISLEYEVRNHFNPFSQFENPLFEEFFKDFFDPGLERSTRRSSLGSGVVIDGENGFVITNAHVVKKSGTVTVVLNDEREFPARIMGIDPESDLAVLAIDSDAHLPSLRMGDSADLMIGETVIAIGNPFGFSNTVTTGVISATNRSFRSQNRVYREFIQTDASINPGNSGGPLLNINGELIGINTAIYAGAQGIGFAIPINRAKRVVADLIAYGEVVMPWIGIRVQMLSDQLVRYFGLESQEGLLVVSVEPGSPAEEAGIQEEDVVVSLNGKSLQSPSDYYARLRLFSPGDPLTVVLWRKGQKEALTVSSTVFPMERSAELADQLLGVTVKSISSPEGRKFRPAAESGVVIVSMRDTSFLARTGVRPGDVIRQINDKAIADEADFNRAIVGFRHQRALALLFQRHQQRFTITVEL